MRVLLDENMPPGIAASLPAHEVFHVDDLGLKSLSNGEILDYARDRFDELVTLDKGILYQHAHGTSPLRIVALRVPNSRKETILARSDDLAKCLTGLREGTRLEP